MHWKHALPGRDVVLCGVDLFHQFALGISLLVEELCKSCGTAGNHSFEMSLLKTAFSMVPALHEWIALRLTGLTSYHSEIFS
jgi:hypothetical protein